MATFTTSPRDCSPTCCVCPAPNGFGSDGNRVCLTFGPARDEPETPPANCYEVCDFCHNMVLETEMGDHKCVEAQAALAAVARELIREAASDAESDSDDERVDPRPAVGGTP